MSDMPDPEPTQMATAVERRTLSNFILTAAAERAERVLAEHNVLTARDVTPQKGRR